MIYTPEQLEKMSDGEIHQAVAELESDVKYLKKFAYSMFHAAITVTIFAAVSAGVTVAILCGWG